MKNKIKEQIKKIKDLETLSEMKEFIDNEMKTRESVITLCNEANSLKESRNFGFVKDSMENISGKLFETKSGREIIKRYVNVIKENKTLSSVHALFESLRKVKNPSLVNELVKEWSENSRFNRKEYNSGIKELSEVLAEGYILSGVPIESLTENSSKEYNTAIMNIVEHRKKDLGDYFNNINVISENIDGRKDGSAEKLAEAIDSFNEKLLEKVSGLEKSGIKENKEAVYKKEKDLCLTKLNEAREHLEKEGDFEACGRIDLFIESIEGKKFNEETITEDLTNFKELAECFS